VEAEVEETFEKAFPAKAKAEIILSTKAGGQLRSGTMEARWEPPDTLPTDDELETKFHWLVGPVLGEEASRKIAAMIWNFEALENLQNLISCCLKQTGNRKKLSRFG
jgi:hypothetical protein